MDKSAMILISSMVLFLVGALMMGIALFVNIESSTTVSLIGSVLMVVAICAIVFGTMVKVKEKESQKKE